MLLPGDCRVVGDMKQQKVRAGLKSVEIQIPTEPKSGSEEEVLRMCEFIISRACELLEVINIILNSAKVNNYKLTPVPNLPITTVSLPTQYAILCYLAPLNAQYTDTIMPFDCGFLLAQDLYGPHQVAPFHSGTFLSSHVSSHS